MVDYVDLLAEQARRQHIADESAAAMARILADPDERASYFDELHWAESLGTPGRA